MTAVRFRKRVGGSVVEPLLIQVADELAREFGDVPQGDVIRVVTDCLREFPSSDAFFIKSAAAARLSARGTGRCTGKDSSR